MGKNCAYWAEHLSGMSRVSYMTRKWWVHVIDWDEVDVGCQR